MSADRGGGVNGYAWMMVGASQQIPVLVPGSVVVERMITSAHMYRLLSSLSAASETLRGPVDAEHVDG